jgi:hypothetical protein
MNQELVTPGVPELSDEWIALRTHHLIDEVATPSTRRSRRYVVTGIGGGVVATTAVLVGLLGPWASPAFAGWSAQPTAPSSDQLSAAEATCASLAINLANVPGGLGSATLAPVSLSDVRGPYSLIVYGTTNPSLCVAGSDFSSLHENGGAISIGGGAVSEAGGQSGSNSFTTNRSSNDSVPAAGGAVVNLTFTATENGQSFTVAEGSVGSRVSGATLRLSNGSAVVATVNNELFAAWWPGQTTVASIQVTATAGVN